MIDIIEDIKQSITDKQYKKELWIHYWINMNNGTSMLVPPAPPTRTTLPQAVRPYPRASHARPERLPRAALRRPSRQRARVISSTTVS